MQSSRLQSCETVTGAGRIRWVKWVELTEDAVAPGNQLSPCRAAKRHPDREYQDHGFDAAEIHSGNPRTFPTWDR